MGIDAKRQSARVLVVISLASFAGLAAWVATVGKTALYERTVSFVVVPDRKFGNSPPPSNVDLTLAGGIGSKAMLSQTLRELGYNPSTAKNYSLQAFVRPGSDILDARLRGPDAHFLSSLASAYVRLSRRWATDHYEAYDLNFLETVPTLGQVSPHPKRTIGLGVVLGGLLGLLVLYAESQLASRRRSGLRRQLLEVPEEEPVEGEPDTGQEPQQHTEEPVRALGRSRDRRGGSSSSRRRRRRAGGQGR